MILRLLALFRAYRDAVDARIRAESDARAERSRADRAEERVRELTDRLEEAHKRYSDAVFQRFLGKRVFSENSTPDASESANFEPRRISPRVLVRQKYQDFFDQLSDLRSPQQPETTDDPDAIA